MMEPEIWIKPTGKQKKILDVTCGDRTIWFQKNEPHTIYCDKRREEYEGVFREFYPKLNALFDKVFKEEPPKEE